MASRMENALQSLREHMLGSVAVAELEPEHKKLLRELQYPDRQRAMQTMERARQIQLQSQQRRQREYITLSGSLRNPFHSSAFGGFINDGELGSALMEVTIPIPDKPSTDMLKAMAAPELVEGDSRQALAIEAEDLLGYTPLRKDAGAPTKLQRLLSELEITPFEITTVIEYKDKMHAHFQAKAEERDRKQPNAWVRYTTEVKWADVPLASYGKPVPEFVIRKCLEIKKHAPEATFFVDELREERHTLDPFMVVVLGGERAYIEVWDEPEFEKAL